MAALNCRQAAPADDGAAEGEESLVEVVADLPADPQAAEPVQEREGGFDDPAVDAQAGAVLGPAAGDDRADAQAAQVAAVGVVVVAAVGVQRIGAPAGTPALALDRRNSVDQGHELGDVVAVPAGQRGGERDTVRFHDHVVLAARPAPVPGDGPVFAPPFIARRWEPLTAARVKSSRSAARNLVSSSSCRACHTPV